MCPHKKKQYKIVVDYHKVNIFIFNAMLVYTKDFCRFEAFSSDAPMISILTHFPFLLRGHGGVLIAGREWAFSCGNEDEFVS